MTETPAMGRRRAWAGRVKPVIRHRVKMVTGAVRRAVRLQTMTIARRVPGITPRAMTMRTVARALADPTGSAASRDRRWRLPGYKGSLVPGVSTLGL